MSHPKGRWDGFSQGSCAEGRAVGAVWDGERGKEEGLELRQMVWEECPAHRHGAVPAHSWVWWHRGLSLGGE